MSATNSSVGDESRLYISQLIWVGVGFGVLLLCMTVHYHALLYLAYPLYIIGIILLVAVLIQGRQVMGASRWLHFGGFQFQPSEFMKLAMVIALARYFHFDAPKAEYSLVDLLIPILLVVCPFLLIVKEPDLGTALLLLGNIGVIFLFMNIRKKHLIALFIVAVAAAPLAYQFALKPYQKTRVLTFMNPFSDPRGAGYNSIQSMIAVGSGQFLGKGFKKGTQAQLDFIPEHHTDFAFSVFAEEQGFFGCLILISFYCALILLGLRAASRARDRFGLFLGFGMCTHLLVQMLVNMGMVTGILPIVGVALPFVSYGGSNMIFSMATIGIILNISLRRYTF